MDDFAQHAFGNLGRRDLPFVAIDASSRAALASARRQSSSDTPARPGLSLASPSRTDDAQGQASSLYSNFPYAPHRAADGTAAPLRHDEASSTATPSDSDSRITVHQPEFKRSETDPETGTTTSWYRIPPQAELSEKPLAFIGRFAQDHIDTLPLASPVDEECIKNPLGDVLDGTRHVSGAM